MLQDETITTEAASVCPECNTKLENRVLESGAGYYIGTWCNCGPYSRESGYYPIKAIAEMVLKSGNFNR